MRCQTCCYYAAAALIAGFLLADDAMGQSRNNTGSGQSGNFSSLFNSLSSSLGSGGSGASSFGSSSATGSGFGGAGAAGSGGAGQAAAGFGGQRGAVGGSGQGGSGFGAGVNQQNQGFIGRNTDPNSFIGRTAQGQMNGQGTTGRQGRNGGGGNRSLDQGLLSQLNGGQNGGGAQQQAPIRPRLKAAFDFPAAKVDAVVSNAQVRFDKLSNRFPQLDQVAIVESDDGTLILTGSVGSRDVAKLAESLLRLEPGVRKVQNDLNYPPPAPE